MGEGGERIRIKDRLSTAARALRAEAFMREFSSIAVSFEGRLPAGIYGMAPKKIQITMTLH
jgi:hypothetical protein